MHTQHDEKPLPEDARKNKKTYFCNLCGKSFVKKNSLEYHILKHAETAGAELLRPHVCHFCGHSFYRESDLRKHLKAKHGPPSFQCSICSTKHATSKRKMTCFRRCAGQGPSHVCQICGKQFMHKDTLKLHHHIHTGEKQFKCDICGARFRFPNVLRVHQYRHGKLKPHTCDICGKGYKYKKEIDLHKLKHHQDQAPREETLVQLAPHGPVVPFSPSLY